MIDLIIRGVVAVVAVVATYLAANATVKVLTGKDIPTHLYAWWAALRDRIVQWKNAHPELRSARIVGVIVNVTEVGVVRLKKMAEFHVFAEVSQNNKVVVTQESISLEELEQQLPGATQGQLLDLTAVC